MGAFLISNQMAYRMLNMKDEGLKAVKCRLHTGNPGAGGGANKALETFEPNGGFQVVGEEEAGGGRQLFKPFEWPEVKHAETYHWISVYEQIGGAWQFNVELTEPKAVEVGNTFKFPLGSILITL